MTDSNRESINKEYNQEYSRDNYRCLRKNEEQFDIKCKHEKIIDYRMPF